MSKSTFTRGSVVWTRWPSPGSRRFSRTARSTVRCAACAGVSPSCFARGEAVRDQLHEFEPAPPCSSPIARIPAATADEIDDRLPDAARRAVAQDGAPAP